VNVATCTKECARCHIHANTSTARKPPAARKHPPPPASTPAARKPPPSHSTRHTGTTSPKRLSLLVAAGHAPPNSGEGAC
jgi:hypothetical protein